MGDDEKSSSSGEGERCWLSRHESLACHTVRDKESGELKNSCERVKQTVRHCLGRPDEVVQDVREHTETPVTQGLPEALGSAGLSILGALQRGLFGSSDSEEEAVGEEADSAAPSAAAEPPLSWRETMELAERLQAAANAYYEERGASKRRAGGGGGTREV